MAARIARTSCPAPSEPSTTTRATSTATAAPNPRDRVRARGRVQSAAGGSGISSRSRRKPSRNSDDIGPSSAHLAQGLAQRRADRPAAYAESVGDLLLREAQVVVRDHHGTLALGEQTEQLAHRDPIEQRVRRRRDRGLPKRADELVEAKRQSRTADPSRASQGDAEEPAAKRVIAPRRAAETFRKRLLKRVLRELRVEQDGDERAVDRWIRGAERRLPSVGLVVRRFGHYLLGQPSDSLLSQGLIWDRCLSLSRLRRWPIRASVPCASGRSPCGSGSSNGIPRAGSPMSLARSVDQGRSSGAKGAVGAGWKPPRRPERGPRPPSRRAGPLPPDGPRAVVPCGRASR